MMENKYCRCYYRIIEKARSRLPPDLYEVHHIVPRCAGGSDDPLNLVKLTLREHYVCHLLLTKMYDGELRYKLMWAVHRMAFSGKVYSRDYEFARRLHRVNSALSNSMIRDRDAWKASIAQSFDDPARREVNSSWMKQAWATGKLTNETARRNSAKAAPFVKRTEIHYNGQVYHGFPHLLRETSVTKYEYQEYYAKGLPIPPKMPASCPHCGTSASPTNMRRFHMSNCKNLRKEASDETCNDI